MTSAQLQLPQQLGVTPVPGDCSFRVLSHRSIFAPPCRPPSPKATWVTELPKKFGTQMWVRSVTEWLRVLGF